MAGATAAMSVSASVIPLLNSRAPHFAEILQPIPNFFLLANSSELNSTFLLTYRNGERADETTATVSLQNATGVYAIAADLPFVDNWYTVNTTITVDSAAIADGNYTLLVQELYQGQVVSDTQQGFALSHDPNANITLAEPTATEGTGGDRAPLGSASPTAYWGVDPAASQAAPVAAAAQTSSSTANTVEGGAGSIGDSLRDLLKGFVARRR